MRPPDARRPRAQIHRQVLDHPRHRLQRQLEALLVDEPADQQDQRLVRLGEFGAEPSKLVIVVLDNRGYGCINRLQQACGGEPFNNLFADCLLALDARIVVHAASLQPEQLPRPSIRPYPSQYIHQWQFKDGTAVTIRPIRPEDEPLMVHFHTTLSERSVYLRYFCSLSLSTRVEHERLVRICFASYDRGFALVAECKNPASGQPEVLGVGRFSAITALEAEAAVLVSDQWQGRGLGTELLASVARVARAEAALRPATSAAISCRMRTTCDSP